MQQGLLLVGEVKAEQMTSWWSAAVKCKERQVFLFEQVLILSEAIGSRSPFASQRYIYKKHMQVTKMTLKTNEEEPTRFLLSDRAGGSDQSSSLFICSSIEERLEWSTAIQTILDTQLDFLRALQSPIAYQKELTKDL